MRNPFDELFEDERPAQAPEEYEEVGGAMTCQRFGCWQVATEGRYYHDDQTLTYVCPAGHFNKSEGISI